MLDYCECVYYSAETDSCYVHNEQKSAASNALHLMINQRIDGTGRIGRKGKG